MKQSILVLFVCAAIAGSLRAEDQDTAAPEQTEAKASQPLVEQLKESPDDLDLYEKYMSQNLRKVQGLVRTKPEQASEMLDEIEEFVDSLEPEKDAGKQQVERIKRIVESYRIQIEIDRVTLEQLADRLRENPEEARTITLYRTKLMMDAMMRMRTAPDKAEEILDKAEELVASLEPEAEDSKRQLLSVKQMIDSYKQRIAMNRMTFEEVTEKLKAEPTDVKLISMYQAKLGSKLRSLARLEPDKAEQILNAAKDLVATLNENAEEDNVKNAIERLESSFVRLEESIATGKRLAALVGTDAAPLEVEAWVNGDPITDEDLKGKVVLLDFWAVWCGPCIMTFPHLRDWHEEYSEKGLEIIGLTRYYGYVWDEEAGRQTRPEGDDKPTPEQEHEMLEKFAEHHELPYRFAIQEDRSLSKYYAVSGIPHVVVIDREGKVRLVRIGASEKTAHDISELLAELFGEGENAVDESDVAETAADE